MKWNKMEQTALSTDECVTKKDLMEWLKNSDIPDDAELRLRYDDEKLKFVVALGWSYSAGAFQDDVVEFSKAESEWILKHELHVL